MIGGSDRKARAALEAILASDRLTLTPVEIAPVLGVDAQSIRIQADAEPAALGFPVIRIGCRTIIPRAPFVQYLTGILPEIKGGN